MAFAKEQPKDGDTILHCGHVSRNYQARVRWFRYQEPIEFSRPDGSRGTAEWLVACEPCFVKHGDQVPARGDHRWRGDRPAIEESELS